MAESRAEIISGIRKEHGKNLEEEIADQHEDPFAADRQTHYRSCNEFTGIYMSKLTVDFKHKFIVCWLYHSKAFYKSTGVVKDV